MKHYHIIHNANKKRIIILELNENEILKSKILGTEFKYPTSLRNKKLFCNSYKSPLVQNKVHHNSINMYWMLLWIKEHCCDGDRISGIISINPYNRSKVYSTNIDISISGHYARKI